MTALESIGFAFHTVGLTGGTILFVFIALLLIGFYWKISGGNNEDERMTAWLLVAIILLSPAPAFARDFGQWAESNPAIRDWIKGLRDKAGQSCCDTADGYEVEGWSFQRPDVPAYYHPNHVGYWVKFKGKWLPVPSGALLDVPNKLGYARVWVIFRDGEPFVRCFIAGAGG